ncbi:glycoside hydrolase family 130 protein [Foetidibacter luteolus]|uniref:glycoside hydrolase family 130 protein n=1 Tax=Foetidibacter luteolus TaxID=2608880 RepID=UPI00129B4EA3|nr:glycoside hydrolase family 130 protein [Foetidibacter luteolus]
MRLPIERMNIKVYPDSSRVIARFFFSSNDRAKSLIQRVMGLEEDHVYKLVIPLLQEFSKRHRNITRVFERHCKKLEPIFNELQIKLDDISLYRKLLIGSYFTHEYSIESAAFFNPSIVEDPDQTELTEGQKRIIISFRAVGEGHISSIVFRRAIIDQHNAITVIPAGEYIDEAEVVRNSIYNKKLFLQKALEAKIDVNVITEVESKLDEHFEYKRLKKFVADSQNLEQDDMRKLEFEKILWLSDSYHEIQFSLDTDISDRVIFPISEFESKGIEDARFVRFSEEDGDVKYYATYTAYDGTIIMPKLLETKDFYHFKVRPLYGNGAQNKNLALFPKKINDMYAMISRIDGWNNYIMYSKNIGIWDEPKMLQAPMYPWEFIQIGNCGSPLETKDGWLVITHGVGPMRRYCLGASLLDLENPSKVIGHLKDPLLVPNDDEREGYVPNVVYSCGSFINNDHIIIPYGLSDYSASFISLETNMLLERLKRDCC